MKKLLFFILILFGILSVQSFAWNYGCGENIPPDVCGAGGAGNSSNNGYTDYSKVPTVNQYLFIMPLNGNNYEFYRSKPINILYKEHLARKHKLGGIITKF